MKGASSALWADIKPSKSEEEKHNIRWTNKVGGRAGGWACGLGVRVGLQVGGLLAVW